LILDALFGKNGHRLRALRGRPDRLAVLRRHFEELIDQTVTRARQQLFKPRPVVPFDGQPRMALITVNYSTTRFLKLMLCTLGQQSHLTYLQRIIIVDNGSVDGEIRFLEALAARVPRVHLVERHHFVNHAAGMRCGMRLLTRLEGPDPPRDRTTILLFCDPDVVFRKPATLHDLAATMIAHNAVFAGEARRAPPGHPDVQASFFVVRRDVVARRDVQPLVNHGSPAYGMQTSIRRAGLKIVDFPSNHGGYVLHRGRTAVTAGAAYGVGGWSVALTNREPHFMGVPNGARIWAEVEDEWASLLEPSAERTLLNHLADRFVILDPSSTAMGSS
jgi:hypothetical protein